VARKTGSEYVLVPVASNIADMNSVFILNETGVFIWEHIDGARSVDEIIAALTEEYDIDPPAARNDTMAFIESIKDYLTVDG
jgi:methyltransferase-like protein